MLPPLRRDLRRRPGPQGQPGLRLRRPVAARRLRRRRRRRPRRHRLQHRGPAAAQARRSSPTDDLLGQVAGALHRAHDRIAELVDEDPALNGTSTTATVALFDGTRSASATSATAAPTSSATASSASSPRTTPSSRASSTRAGSPRRRRGSTRTATSSSRRSTASTRPSPTCSTSSSQPGDRLLLCSDGACGVLDDGRLADILASGTPDYAAVELVRASLEAGSTDNVTCVVADVVDGRRPRRATSQPLLVGAAADLPRRSRAAARCGGLFRGHRAGDTGELEPVAGRDPRRRRSRSPTTRSTPRRRATPRGRRAASPGCAGCWSPRSSLGLVWVALAAGLVVEPAAVLRRRARRHGRDLPRRRRRPARRRRSPTPYETTDVELDRLSDYDAGQVREGIDADNLDDARHDRRQLRREPGRRRRVTGGLR